MLDMLSPLPGKDLVVSVMVGPQLKKQTAFSVMK